MRGVCDVQLSRDARKETGCCGICSLSRMKRIYCRTNLQYYGMAEYHLAWGPELLRIILQLERVYSLSYTRIIHPAFVQSLVRLDLNLRGSCQKVSSVFATVLRNRPARNLQFHIHPGIIALVQPVHATQSSPRTHPIWTTDSSRIWIYSTSEDSRD